MAPDMNGVGPSSQPMGSGSPKKRPRHSDSASASPSTTTTTKKRIKPTTVFANGPSGSASSSNGNGVASTASSSSSPSSTPHPNSLAATRARLPISSSRDQIVSSIRSNETIILIADTGSGKSTQVPQFLHEAGGFTEKGRLVGITQPRRMAAISLAKRVGQELGESDPDAEGENGSPLVGYAIRFQDKTTRRTRIKFMTDGWLLREFVRGAAQLVKQGMDIDEVDDPSHPSLLPQYSCLIIDEAHERSVRTDLLLGLAKRVQRRRRQLRKAWEGKKAGKEPHLLHIVVMSATLDADLFSRFFANNNDDVDNPQPAPVLYVQGRTHPVTLSHLLEPATDWIDAAKRQILQLHVSRTLPGDILVFGTGAEEIESLCSSLRHLSAHLPQWAEDRQRATGQKTVVGGLHVVPLYAALGNRAVAEVYRATPKGMRKVVVATNIAETSVTIPGVRYVVDCGLAKEKMHVAAGAIAPAQQQQRQAHQSQQQGIETLTTRPISQSAASQRAGRAGREAPGECFRLYPRTELEAMDETTVPEIHRTELSSVALDCFAAGVDPRDVEWVDRPVGGRLDAAVLELGGMGAVRAVERGERKEEEKGKKTRLVLTELGQRMALLPLPPRFSHLLITAATSSSPAVVRQARDLVAILSSERTIFQEPSAAALLSTSANSRPNGVGGKEEGGGSDISERLELKRAEAERARSAFRHWSGDHVTMLRTFYAYLRVKESAFAAASTATNGSSNGKQNGSSNGTGHHQQSASARAKATAEVKTWCNAHFLSLRALREIEEIRDQIDGICVRAGILPRGSKEDEGQSSSSKVGRRGANGAGREDAGDSSESSDDESAGEEDSDEDAPLRVIKRGQKAKDEEDEDDSHLLDDADEDYSLLRRCLVSGRSLAHLAMRLNSSSSSSTSSTTNTTSSSSSYRVLCGREVFKLHPTSSLHPSRSTSTSGRGGNVQLPKMVVFEELQFTTQLYVRVASAVDVEWVREMAGLGTAAVAAGGTGGEAAVKGE